MVSEHNALGFPPELMGDTFGLAYFGNGMVAIAAGVTAEVSPRVARLSAPILGP